MAVPPALLPFFSSSSRDRGEDYAFAGRVRIFSSTATDIDALVRGNDTYSVHLSNTSTPRERVQTIEVSCTCPYFEGGAETCKHIFAVIDAASRKGGTFLDAFASAPKGSVEIVPTLDTSWQPEDEVDLADLPSGDRDAAVDRIKEFWRRRRADRDERQAGRDPKPAAPSGRQFLKTLRSDLARTSLTAATFRYRPDELIYVIDLASAHHAGLTIEVMARQRKKNGEWGTPARASIAPMELQAAPREDAEILSTLLGAGYTSGAYAPGYSGYGGAYQLQTIFPVPATMARMLLPRIAATGRTYLRRGPVREPELTPLGWDAGPPWKYRIDAAPHGDGVLLTGQFQRGTDTIPTDVEAAVLEAGFLVTPTTIARADLPPARGLMTALLRIGAIELSNEEVASLAELLAKTNQSSPDLPAPLRVPEVDVAPRPRLSIRPMGTWALRDHLEAHVAFDYDGTTVDADANASTWDPAKKRVIRRRASVEDAAIQRAEALGVTQRMHPYARTKMRVISARVMPSVVRALVGDGWQVEAEGKLLRRPSGVAMSVSSGIDWFDLSAKVEFAGDTVPLTDILAALKRGDTTIPLDDGTVGLLPEEWLERYAPLAALGEVDGDRLRFKLPQTALLDALLDAQADDITVTVDAQFAAARDALTRFDRIAPADPPASFQGTLRPYQKDGLGWLGFLRQFGFGGCLADDMGLGKTVMVLAMLDAWRRARPAGEPARPSLVVAPRSLIHNWMAESRRFTPELRVRDCSHATRKSAAGLWDDLDLALVTYGTLRRDIHELKDREFDYVILDEAQAIKNAGTASAKASRLLRGRHRLALSGTPIENHLGELWSLFEFLNPGLLGRSSVFAGVNSDTRTVDPETARLLSRGLRPFILRRTKAQVATDLPPKSEQTIICELEGKQRTLYNSLRVHYREALLGRIDRVGLKKSKLQVLEALLRLRQAACHPALIDPAHAKVASAKLDVLVPQLRDVVEEGHKAIVFSQFTSFLAHVRDALDREQIAFEYLDGQTRDREARVKRFQTDPACPVFLVSLKAGGLGLNLTAAEYVFLLDPWWNPAVEAQAIDRAHRIGQTEHVFAYRLIARDTVEEKVLELQQSKRALADAILRADAGLVGQLEREDLELLLS